MSAGHTGNELKKRGAIPHNTIRKSASVRLRESFNLNKWKTI